MLEEAKLGEAAARQKNTARRRLKSLLTTKKGTSPGIVALLLILVIFVAGFFFYNNITAWVGVMQNSVQEQMETLFLRSFSMNNTCITSFIGNNGILSASIMNAYINDQIADLKQSVEIEKGSVEPVYVLGTFSKGSAYAVELVCNLGGSVQFDVTYT